MNHSSVDISHSRSSHLAVHLCWEPAEHDVGYRLKKFLWKISRRFTASEFFREDADLDLSCYVFDEEGRCLCRVSGDSRELIDPSGSVNHTGNNRNGYGSIDESISLKLAQMPAEYQQLIFVVTSPHKRAFHDIDDGKILIENRSASETIYTVPLGQGEGHQFAYVACGIFKQPQGWHIEELSHYTGLEENWPLYLRRYLPARD